jgi:lipid A 3-O-deacylase
VSWRPAVPAARTLARALARATTTVAIGCAAQAGGAESVGRLDAQVDNDRFASGRHDDRWYTSGVMLRGYRAAAGTPIASLADLWCGRVGGCGAAATAWSVLTIGQQLHTPGSSGRTRPQPYDRPYAGWLFAAPAVLIGGGDTSQLLGMRIGVVGPAALGKPSQNGVHRLLGQQPAGGWEWQLRPALAVQADYAHLRRHPLGTGVDVVRRLALTAGNLALQAAAGASVRWGDLPAAPTYPGQPADAGLGGSREGAWHVFAGGEFRLVGWDRLVDGPTFGYESQVTARAVTGDLHAGMSVGLARELRLDFVVTVRTAEFDAPAESARMQPQRFGTIRLRWTPSG